MEKGEGLLGMTIQSILSSRYPDFDSRMNEGDVLYQVTMNFKASKKRKTPVKFGCIAIDSGGRFAEIAHTYDIKDD